MASASLMTTKIKGKTRVEAAALLQDFQGMITGKTPEDEAPKSLGDLRLLSGVRKFPQRDEVRDAGMALRCAGRESNWRSISGGSGKISVGYSGGRGLVIEE